jgi:hypothetical protein
MKKRYLLVIENRETGERFLLDRLKYDIPAGYVKVTSSIPLDEEKFGHLPIYTIN